MLVYYITAQFRLYTVVNPQGKYPVQGWGKCDNLVLLFEPLIIYTVLLMIIYRTFFNGGAYVEIL